MKIRFGLHLDGQRGWQPKNSFGEIIVGPLGLLDILETQLGLLQIQASQSERIVEYRDALRQCDTSLSFFHRTFQADELGTAATLLAWRDTWYLHGWDGQVLPESPTRVRSMGEIERFAADKVPFSIGERLRNISQLLHDHKVPIKKIELLDPLETFPKRWRDVLSSLPVQAHDVFKNVANGSGFLGQLQAALNSVQTGGTPNKLQWTSDGSVTVVQAETRFLAGRWLAGQIGQINNSTLLVAPIDGERLDGILVSSGLPRQGLRESSAFRPSLQVLPLALEILWEPLNFYGLLQFLTHSVCPIVGYARYRLADKLADKPGIGGTTWDEVLLDIEEHYRGKGSDRAKTVLEKIRFWVEHPRYDQTKGADINAVIERVDSLTEYFRGRLADTDPSARIAFNAGYNQCQATADALKALKEQGSLSIRPRQLQKLVTQATAQGSENPLHIAEVGASLSITHPGAAIEPCERVLWWQMGMPLLPGQYPWSSAEIANLAKSGVDLPDVSSLLDRAADEWLRPLLAAKNELVLVLPPKGEEVHPVWQMLEALVKEIPVTNLEDNLTRQSPGMNAVIHQPLPSKKRFWKLPVEVAMRQKESFSSLEKLIFNPYHWLLQYPAKLRTSQILAVADDFLLFGNLSHDLVEAFFQLPNSIHTSPKVFEQWFQKTFDRIVVEDGAVLLMPGRRSDLEGLRIKLKQSVQEIQQQLAKAKVKRVYPEMALNGTYAGGELTGFADLVLEKDDLSRAIVDMKWAGAKKYPLKLQENRHLQLAIYAELLRQQYGTWPSLGYFILDRGRLFTKNNDWFPSAEVVKNASDEDTPELWQRFIEAWKWRQRQFKKGLFEVALEDIAETADSIPPDKALGSEYLNPAYNDYLTLAGWDELS